MSYIAYVLPLAFRLGFFALSTTGLLALITCNGRREDAHLRVLGAIGLLFLSCLTSAKSRANLVLLLALFAVLVACDLFFVKRGRRAGEIFLPVALLAAIGAAVGFDVMGSQASSHIVHLMVACLGCVATFVVVRRLSHRFAASYVLFLVLTVVLCALPLIPGLGVVINGSKAWIGVAGRSIAQPSEFAKVTLALSLAAYLAANVGRLSSFNLRGILPLVAIFLLAFGTEWMVKDIGTAVVLFATVAAMVMISSRRAGVIYALTAAVGVAAMLYVAYHNFPHVAQRFDAWLTPEGTYSGEHLLAAASAMGNGGFIGTGLGFGRSFARVYAADTDAIYAAIVEELGLVGGAQVVLAYVVLAVQTSRLVRALPRESFERNLVNVSSVLICVQAFVIIAGITRVIPLTGVTLPFVSRGGSSQLSSFAIVGLMGAAGSIDKVGTNRHSTSSLVVPAAATLGFAACLAMTVSTVIGVGGLRLCGLTAHYTIGAVRSSDGVVLIRMPGEGEGDTYVYPEGSLAAHALGVQSGGIAARIWTEDALYQESNPLLNLLGIPETLGDVTLTLDTQVQRAAEAQLEGVVGAIVVLDAETGEVLAEASNPTFDPNVTEIELDNPDVSVFNRATQSQYAPGSTFKIVTAAAALESGLATPASTLNGDAFSLSGGERIVNFGRYEYGPITLATALEYSSNTAFADLALQMNDELIKAQAEAFGFNQEPLDAMLAARSSTYVSATSEYTRAWSSVGQPTLDGDVESGPRVTVLQIAEVMAAIANGGERAVPHLVKEGEGKLPPQMWSRRAVSRNTAELLWGMLVQASHANASNAEVAGKTGTAETSNNNACWYVCSANGIVVACCIEGSAGTGTDVALPRALAVLGTIVDLGI